MKSSRWENWWGGMNAAASSPRAGPAPWVPPPPKPRARIAGPMGILTGTEEPCVRGGPKSRCWRGQQRHIPLWI